MAKGFAFFSGLGGGSLFGGVVMSFPVTPTAAFASSCRDTPEQGSEGWLPGVSFCSKFSNGEGASIGKVDICSAALTGSGEAVQGGTVDCPLCCIDANWESSRGFSSVCTVPLSLIGTVATFVSKGSARSEAGAMLLSTISSVPECRSAFLARGASVSADGDMSLTEVTSSSESGVTSFVNVVMGSEGSTTSVARTTSVSETTVS